MIVPMAKVHAACRRSDADRLMTALRDLGVVHLAPVERTAAVPDEATTARDRAARPSRAGAAGGSSLRAKRRRMTAVEAAAEVLRVQRESAERHSRLNALHRQAEQLAVWGDVRLEQLGELRRAGIEPRFFAVPNKRLGELRRRAGASHHRHCRRADRWWRWSTAPGELAPPEGAEPLPLPSRDRPSILAEAAAIDASLRADTELLGRLAHLAPALDGELAEQRRQAAYTVADARGLRRRQPVSPCRAGCPPTASTGCRRAGEGRRGRGGSSAGTRRRRTSRPRSSVPVRWARPIEALFKILGTVPGYREFDVSGGVHDRPADLLGDADLRRRLRADRTCCLPIIFYRKMSARSSPSC